jgi:hypothetical protein
MTLMEFAPLVAAVLIFAAMVVVILIELARALHRHREHIAEREHR